MDGEIAPLNERITAVTEDPTRFKIGRAIGLTVDVTSAASMAQGRATVDAVLPLVDVLLAELAAARERASWLEDFIQRMETQHVTFTGPDGIDTHPDWCRECRVDRAYADARREIDRREQEGTAEHRRMAETVQQLEEHLAAANLRMGSVLGVCDNSVHNSRIPTGEAGLGYLAAQEDILKAIDHVRAPGFEPAHREAARQLLTDQGWTADEAAVISIAMALFVARRAAAGDTHLPGQLATGELVLAEWERQLLERDAEVQPSAAESERDEA